MTGNEAIKIFNDLLDVPCEMLIKYDSVINSEKKQSLVRLRTAEELAIQALEKQIPKKVVYYRYDRCGYYLCPACNHYICDKETAFSLNDTDFSYCDGCGQKLDWSDEE